MSATSSATTVPATEEELAAAQAARAQPLEKVGKGDGLSTPPNKIRRTNTGPTLVGNAQAETSILAVPESQQSQNKPAARSKKVNKKKRLSSKVSEKEVLRKKENMLKNKNNFKSDK